MRNREIRKYMWDFSTPLSIADKIRRLKMSRNLEDGKKY